MEFKEVIKFFKENKKIRQMGWRKHKWIELDKKGVYDESGSNYEFDASDFFCEDWEEYVEEDNWNWHGSVPTVLSPQYNDAVVKLKEKILEDLSRVKIPIKSIEGNSIVTECDKRVKEIIHKRFGF